MYMYVSIKNHTHKFLFAESGGGHQEPGESGRCHQLQHGDGQEVAADQGGRAGGGEGQP